MKAEVNFVGLSLSEVGIAEFLKAYPLEFPVYLNATEINGRKPDLNFTPLTLWISHGGRIERIWRGAYRDIVRKEIERVFRVRLPGLPDERME